MGYLLTAAPPDLECGVAPLRTPVHVQPPLLGRGVAPLGPNYGGGNEDNGDLLPEIPCITATLSVPDPAPDYHQPTPPLETPGHSWASLGQSAGGKERANQRILRDLVSLVHGH